MVRSSDRCNFCGRTRTQAGAFVQGGPADSLIHICKECTDNTLTTFREFNATQAINRRRTNKDIIKMPGTSKRPREPFLTRVLG